MSFASARARLAAAKYRHLGSDATWNGQAARVRVIEGDKQTGGGFDLALVRATFIEVAASLSPKPEKGDTVILLDDDGNVTKTYSVISEPRLVHDGLDWSCEADV